MRKTMTIRHLQIFKTVCQCQSISAAAEKLNMTQPAVSIAVKELESFYQVRLFDRMNRTIYLTEAGNILREYADAILDRYEEAAAILRDGSSFMKCRLGVNVSVGETLLAGILEKLKGAIPDMGLEIFVENTESLEQKLNNNEIDFAVVDSLKDKAKRGIVPFYRGEMVIVCGPEGGPSGGLTVRALAECRLLLREKGSGSRICTDAMFARHGCQVKPAVESISDLSLLNLAEAGLGITIMPRELVSERIAAGRLREIPLEDDKMNRQYFIAYNEKKYLTVFMKRVLSVLQNYEKNE